MSDMHEVLAILRQQQTKRGKKHLYTPIDPTLYSAKRKEPIFTLADIDTLNKIIPVFPSGKIEIQKCDQKQNLTRVQMDRRQAFVKLLNQAVGQYLDFKKTDFIKPKDLFGKIEAIKAAIEEIHKLLNPDKQDEAGCFIIDRLKQLKAPLVPTRLSTGKLGVHCKHLGIVLQNHYQRVKAASAKTPRNRGDIAFYHLIDDLLKIWVVIFERDVGTSSKNNKRTGPLLRFVCAVLVKAGIKKSDDTIVKAAQRWKRQYGESYKSKTT
jgi:hypothetical protein